ncbi:MAG TPA: tetraacyldisaccharide 4'-kinase [Enterovirga sp.]
MKAPDFWWGEPGVAAHALTPLSHVYGAIAARRMAEPGARAAVPVICVGNVTVGGAGKTPTALALTAMLVEMGRRPFVLLRGYGGRLPGPVRVEPARHGTTDVGDEALLLARTAPTIVARDRPAGAALAVAEGADVIVMDDGLQNPSLAKDLSLAVFDAAVGVGNGLCLPAGPLRAPLTAQWPRIDAAIVIGDGAPGDAVAAQAALRLPVFRAALRADPGVAAALADEPVLAFAGIGRPAKFFETLRGCGATLAETRAFPDHHPFTAAEIGTLLDLAERRGLRPVTTEKDAVRLAPLAPAEPRIAGIATLPVRLAFAKPDAMAALVAGCLERWQAAPDQASVRFSR